MTTGYMQDDETPEPNSPCPFYALEDGCELPRIWVVVLICAGIMALGAAIIVVPILLWSRCP